jgi:hypothetical protein
MKNNYIIIRLHLLMLSPVFSSLLTFIILIVNKIYFDPVILCDNGCSPLLLDQLKANLSLEIRASRSLGDSIRNFLNIINETETSGEVNSAQRAKNKVILDG